MTTSVSDGLRHATQKARDDDKENGESCDGGRNAWREELFHGGIAEPCSESSTQPCEARPFREGIPPRDFRGRWREFGAHNSGYCGAACKWAEEEEEEGGVRQGDMDGTCKAVPQGFHNREEAM